MSKHTRNCVICGTEFAAPPSSRKVTCSPSCRSERARQSNTGTRGSWSEDKKAKRSAQGQPENFKKGTQAAQLSAKSGPFETHINALIWTIKSPDGVTYNLRNLNLWIREHADLLPGTPEQARAGFMQIKRSIQGKTKRSVGSWKGWKLLKWETPEGVDS